MSGQASGILLIYFGEAVLITLLGSTVLLWLYRRTVSRGMRAQPASTAAVAARPAAVPTVASAGRAGPASPTVARWRARLVVVYGVAGMLAAAVLATLFLASLGEPPNGLRAFVVWYAYGWPLVPTYVALLALPRKPALWLLAGYVALGMAVVLGWSLASLVALPERQAAPLGNVGSFLSFLAIEAAPPLLVIVAVSSRRLRSVSAFLLAGLLVFSFSNLLVNHLLALGLDYPALQSVVRWLGAETYLTAWFMLAAFPIGYACWRVLGWLSRAHERKAFSDVQLVVDSWWLIAVFFVTSSLAGEFGWGALSALLAFVGYRATVAVGLRLWPAATSTAGRNRLLLLRVFGFQWRTERLFDAVAQRWRLAGGVRLIAAADLATRAVDPGDIIAFMGGRLRDRFVAGEADVGRHLARIDDEPDPDGRFRVAKFFCHDATWRAMLQALLSRSDAVLFDLRGFAPANTGCRYELGELSRAGLLPRTVLVVDGTTDRGLLETTLAEIAPKVAGGGDRPRAGPLIERVRPRSSADLERVRRRLGAAAMDRLTGP